MGSVKALKVALSDGTGCVAELEVQQCLHPHCVDTALLGRTVPDEVSDTLGIFPIKTNFEVQVSWGYRQLRLDFPPPGCWCGAEQPPPAQWSRSPKMSSGGHLLHGKQQGCLAGVLPHGIKTPGQTDSSGQSTKAQIISKIRYTSLPLFIFGVADRAIAKTCLPSLPAPSGSNSLGSLA